MRPLFPEETIAKFETRQQHATPSLRGETKEDLLRIVREVGLVALFHHPGLPSVQQSMKVPVYPTIWAWVNSLSYKEKKLFYGCLLKRNLCIIPIEDWPFYYVALRKKPKLRDFDMQTLEVIRTEGPVSSSTVRKMPKAKRKLVAKSIRKLDKSFMIARADTEKMPSGWSIVRWVTPQKALPQGIFEERNKISSCRARKEVLLRYFRIKGPVIVAELKRLFGFPEDEIKSILQGLLDSNRLVKGYFTDCKRGIQYILRDNLKVLATMQETGNKH
jgi:hypothetical protein